MLKTLLRDGLSGLATLLLADGRRLSGHLFRIEAAACYLRGVQAARTAAIGLLRLKLVLGLISVGALLFHAGLFVYLPCSLRDRALLAMALGGVYAIIGGLILRAVLKERAWMSASGAARLLAEATHVPPQG